MYSLDCEVCGLTFNHRQANSKTCSTECHKKRIGVSKPISKTCTQCGTNFSTTKPNAKNCSSVCSRQYEATKWGRKSAYPDVSSGTVGAITEMAIAVYFMSRGYEVFRSLSPACGADIVIFKETEQYRLECRTGYRYPLTGSLSFPKKVNGQIDAFAVYIPLTNEFLFFKPDAKTLLTF